MQILLQYLGGELQSLVIMMSSCSAQCIPCSTGSGWVEITRCICTVLSHLTSNRLQTTVKTEGDRGSTRLPEKKLEELSRDRTSAVIAFITLQVTAC